MDGHSIFANYHVRKLESEGEMQNRQKEYNLWQK